ncbi:MAG: hypothetical protein ACXU9X_05695, partial [Thermodesulfobacteriota bacterium]
GRAGRERLGHRLYRGCYAADVIAGDAAVFKGILYDVLRRGYRGHHDLHAERNCRPGEKHSRQPPVAGLVECRFDGGPPGCGGCRSGKFRREAECLQY